MMANRAERAHPRPTHLKKPQRGQRQRAHNSAVIWPHDLPLLLSHWPNNCYTLCYATSRPPMIGIPNSSYHRNSSEIVFFKYQRLFISYLWLCQIWLFSQRLAVMIFLTTGCFVCLMKTDVTCFPILKRNILFQTFHNSIFLWMLTCSGKNVSFCTKKSKYIPFGDVSKVFYLTIFVCPCTTPHLLCFVL